MTMLLPTNLTQRQPHARESIDQGNVVGIFVAPEPGAPMHAVERVRAVPGRGLEGDRYFDYDGRPVHGAGRAKSVTLIESEALTALEREHGVRLGAAESRRNLVTSAVALNHLVGREFSVGGVTLRGIEPCQPCLRLQQATREGVLRGLVSRGGLRAEIVRGGVIRVGDSIRTEASTVER